MTVICQQFVDGDLSHESVIEPHFDGQADDALLAAKAEGAADKGWDVEWLDESSFVARKVRWDPDRLCERLFRVT